MIMFHSTLPYTSKSHFAKRLNPNIIAQNLLGQNKNNGITYSLVKSKKNHVQWEKRISSMYVSTKSNKRTESGYKSQHRESKSINVWEIPFVQFNDKVCNVSDDIEQMNGKLYYSVPIRYNNIEVKETKKWLLSLDTSTSIQKSQPEQKYPTQKVLTEKIHKYLLTHLLPTNYPDSVDAGYTDFASYCFLANSCGSAAMVFSTQTLLIAVGVGSAVASPMAGALNWVMRDGIGQLGGVLFASRITSNTRENTIDKDPKRWRMVSAISMDCATLLEILSPLFPGYFLLVASIANIGKNIGFLTASASRAALHQSLAVKDNLGDITAKAGSQSIAASILGTGIGVGLTPFIGENHLHITLGFICLSVVHQYCTYKSLKAVALKKFNKHRLIIALDLYLHDVMFLKQDDNHKNCKSGDSECFLSPTHIAEFEKFLPFSYPDDSYKWLRIGAPLIKIAPTPEIWHRLTKECLGNEKYILNCEVESLCHDSVKINDVLLAFHHDAKDTDIIRGMFHAQTIKYAFSKSSHGELHYSLGNMKLYDKKLINEDLNFHIISETYQFMIDHQDDFLNRIEREWELNGESISVESISSYRFKILETK